MFTEIKTGKKAVRLQNMQPGKSFIARLVNCREVETTFGKTAIWEFISQSEGKPFSVWGFAALDCKLSQVPQGTIVRITFEGKSEVQNKFGKFPYRVKVEVDADSKKEGYALERVDSAASNFVRDLETHQWPHTSESGQDSTPGEEEEDDQIPV